MPGKLLSAVNESFCSILEQSQIGSFASAFALDIDIDTRVLRYSSARHPPPLLITLHYPHLAASPGVETPG